MKFIEMFQGLIYYLLKDCLVATKVQGKLKLFCDLSKEFDNPSTGDKDCLSGYFCRTLLVYIRIYEIFECETKCCMKCIYVFFTNTKAEFSRTN
jgi:hypothetical protein